MADQTTDSLSLGFTVTRDMVDSFARLSGDYNSMHMNPEVARRSRFRRPIVHGMLPFSFICMIQDHYKDQHITFKELSAHFNKPVFLHDSVLLTVKCRKKDSHTFSIHGEWHKEGSDELLLVARGRFELQSREDQDSINQNDNHTSFLSKPLEENRYTINDLDEQNETLAFELTLDLLEQYNREVLRSRSRSRQPDSACRCTNLFTTLLLSTMVGMRLPGRYATFTRFHICFDDIVQLHRPCTMTAELSRVSREAEHMQATFSIRDSGTVMASGKYDVSLNSPPKPMLTCNEILEHHLNLGLSGKVALITGASRGIGETTAKLLAMHGVRSVVTYLHGKSDAERIVKEIKDAGGEAFASHCDITRDEQVDTLVSGIIERYEGIDILVNNAVKEFSPREILELDWDDYLGELEVSVKGMHACCKAVIPLFKNAGGGKIINMSSVAVANPVEGQSRYITAKSAVEGYTKSLAIELAKHNIQANLVVPNMTDTDLVSVIPAFYREKIADSRPGNRHVQPIEVAQSIAYLASNWSDAMTGQKIVLNLGEPPFA